METSSRLRVRVVAALIVLLMGLVGCCGSGEPGKPSTPSGPGAVLGVAIDGGDVTLAVGASQQLTVTVSTTGDASREVGWSSSREDVASVSMAGLVTAVAEGSTQITATSLADTSKTDGVTVTVTPATPDPVDSGTVSAEDVRAFAIGLYDTVEAEASPADLIRDLVDAFGWYVAEDAAPSDVEEAMAGRVPVVLEDHVLGMARGFESALFVTVDSFVASMVEFGAYSKVTSAPLTLTDLSDGLAPLVAQEVYETNEVVAALIVHLGLERATRAGALDDAVWGDGLLDPLQFMLLAYAVLLSGDDDAVGQVAPRGRHDGVPHDLKNLKIVVDLALPFIGVPGPVDVVPAVVCMSALIPSYVMRLEIDEDSIRRRWPENPAGSSPYQSELRATLVFDFVPRNQAWRIIIEEACGAPLPPVGPVSGSTVGWLLGGELPQHGSLEVHDAETGPSGVASATYVAFDERVPRLLRHGLPPAASGSVSVSATNVLPWKWRNLMLIRRAKGEGPRAATRIFVRHYEFPELEAVVAYESLVGDVVYGPWFSTEASARPRLAVNEDGSAYVGAATFAHHAGSAGDSESGPYTLIEVTLGDPTDFELEIDAGAADLRLGRFGLIEWSDSNLPVETYWVPPPPRTSGGGAVLPAAPYSAALGSCLGLLGHYDARGIWLPGPWQQGSGGTDSATLASMSLAVECFDAHFVGSIRVELRALD